MKIKFTCNKCSESFNVSSDYLLKKDSIICPNCSYELPKESFKHLQTGISEISKCSSTIPSLDTDIYFGPAMDFEIIN